MNVCEGYDLEIFVGGCQYEATSLVLIRVVSTRGCRLIRYTASSPSMFIGSSALRLMHAVTALCGCVLMISRTLITTARHVEGRVLAKVLGLSIQTARTSTQYIRLLESVRRGHLSMMMTSWSTRSGHTAATSADGATSENWEIRLLRMHLTHKRL